MYEKYFENLQKNCQRVAKLPPKEIQKEIKNIYNLPVPIREKEFVLTTLHQMIPQRKLKKLNFGNTKKNIHIITDLGEECDDEVTVFCAILYAHYNHDIHFTIVFTDKHWQDSALKAGIDPSTKYTNVTFVCIHNNCNSLIMSHDSIIPVPDKVLQIGPMNDENNKYYKYYTEKLENGSFDYYIVGTIGNTLNSSNQEGSNFFAEKMIEKSNRHYIIDTKKGLGAPQFNVNIMENIINTGSVKLIKENLLNHVMNIGFRNTVGRTLKFYGAFLVSSPNGANYKTVYNQSQLHPPSTEKQLVTDDTIIHEVVNEYFNKLREDNPNIDINQDQFNGYYFILKNLQEMYGITPKIYVSGSPGNWEKSWDKLFYSNENSELKNSLNIFKEKVIKYSFPLTPAYDCVGLYAVLLGDNIGQKFNEEKSDIWSLKGINKEFDPKKNNQKLEEVIEFISGLKQ